MKNNRSTPVNPNATIPDDAFSDSRTDRKIHRHLSDINDVISEQDINDVRTDFNDQRHDGNGQVDSSEPTDNLQHAQIKHPDSKEVEKEDAVPIVTPWTVLGT